MWDILINPFVTALAFMYSILGNNIILAIVVLTVIIRMLTYPLLAKQQQSSKKMQELGPELEKIKEKYKNEREKLSQAQMELYKTHGVNPLGGCLPLLVQFPILIGLYQSISVALASTPYELIDLSDRFLISGLDHLIPLQNTWLGMNLALPPTPGNNPTFALALPALVVATTFLQTRFSMAGTPKPAGGQSSQAQQMTQSMSTIMPIMFGVFALSFSVGLSVYFIVSNLVGIVQYSPIGKRYLDPIFAGGGSDKKPELALEDGTDTAKSKSNKAKAEKPQVIEGKATNKSGKKQKKARSS